MNEINCKQCKYFRQYYVLHRKALLSVSCGLCRKKDKIANWNNKCDDFYQKDIKEEREQIEKDINSRINKIRKDLNYLIFYIKNQNL